MTKNALWLEDRGVVRVGGADAAGFLQGVVTNDVERLVPGEARYAAVWIQSGGPPWQARHGLTAAQYQAEFNSLAGQGFRLRHVRGYKVGGQDLYAAIWDKSPSSGWLARHGLSADDYQVAFDATLYQGYRLICVAGYSDGAQARYAGIWESE